MDHTRLVARRCDDLGRKAETVKSCLALQIGFSVATGQEVLGRSVHPGAVLYSALEDNERRLKSRLKKVAASAPIWPENFLLATDWPRLDGGGLNRFQAWVEQEANARLLIIDALATVRPASGGRDSQYQSDYSAVRGLHSLAKRTGIGILVVHHVRKMDAEDPFDTVSGTTGLTGAVDSKRPPYCDLEYLTGGVDHVFEDKWLSVQRPRLDERLHVHRFKKRRCHVRLDQRLGGRDEIRHLRPAGYADVIGIGARFGEGEEGGEGPVPFVALAVAQFGKKPPAAIGPGSIHARFHLLNCNFIDSICHGDLISLSSDWSSGQGASDCKFFDHFGFLCGLTAKDTRHCNLFDNIELAIKLIRYKQ